MISVELSFSIIWLEWIFAPLGLTAWSTMALGCLAVSAYLVLGGYSAVLRTDRWQLIVVMGCIGVISFLILHDASERDVNNIRVFLAGSGELWEWVAALLALIAFTVTRFVMSPDAWMRAQLWNQPAEAIGRRRAVYALCSVAIAVIFVCGSAFGLVLSFDSSPELIQSLTNDKVFAFELYRGAVQEVHDASLVVALLAVAIIFAAMSTVDTFTITVAQLNFERQLLNRSISPEIAVRRPSAERSLKKAAHRTLASVPLVVVTVVIVLYQSMYLYEFLDLVFFAISFSLVLLGANFGVFLLILFSSRPQMADTISRSLVWTLFFVPSAVIVLAGTMVPLPAPPPIVIVALQTATLCLGYIVLICRSKLVRKSEVVSS